MNVIWKAVLRADNDQYVHVPIGSEFLFVHEQSDQICLWFRCDPAKPKEPRMVGISGTGHDNADGKYIGSAVLHGGALVFHVFDRSAS